MALLTINHFDVDRVPVRTAGRLCVPAILAFFCVVASSQICPRFSTAKLGIFVVMTKSVARNRTEKMRLYRDCWIRFLSQF